MKLKWIIFPVLFFFGGAPLVQPAQGVTPESLLSENLKDTIFYVYAKAGLIVRKSPDLKGKVIEVLEPGSSFMGLELTGKKMTFQGWKGQWVKVDIDEAEGYLFSAFISTIPPCKKPEKFKECSDFLSEEGVPVLYESFRDDNIGHIVAGESITVEISSAQEAFLVGRTLLDLPEGFSLPPSDPEAKGYHGLDNPEKDKDSWSDRLDIKRDKKGNIIEFRYNSRWEGFGKGAVIQKSARYPNRWKFESYMIAD